MKPSLRGITREFMFSTAYILLLLGSVMFVLPPLAELAETEYQIFPVLYAKLVITIVLGMLLGIPSLIKRWKTHRGFNWTKLLIQGLPAFIIGSPRILMEISFQVSIVKFFPSLQGLMFNSDIYFISYLAGVWFGKVLIDCIKGAEKMPSFKAN